MRVFFAVFAMLWMTGCSGMSFEPYNYEKFEDAKLKKDSYHVRLKARRFVIEKTIQLYRDCP